MTVSCCYQLIPQLRRFLILLVRKEGRGFCVLGLISKCAGIKTAKLQMSVKLTAVSGFDLPTFANEAVTQVRKGKREEGGG